MHEYDQETFLVISGVLRPKKTCVAQAALAQEPKPFRWKTSFRLTNERCR